MLGRRLLRARRRRSIFGVSLLLACSALGSSCSSVTSAKVNASADDRADRAGIVMFRERDGSALDMARRVVGGGPTGTRIEVLVAEGDRFGGRIVLRIVEVIEVGSFDFNEGSAVRCYEYVLEHSADDHKPRRITCPDVDPLVVPTTAPRPTLPPNVEETLRATLEDLLRTEPVTEERLRAALDSFGALPVSEVASAGSTFGLAIGNADDECVYARIVGDVVELWRVPPAQAVPGELGCTAASAARGEGRTAPH